jgi:hypothetical protein
MQLSVHKYHYGQNIKNGFGNRRRGYLRRQENSLETSIDSGKTLWKLECM